jgi:hypothetical protein
MAKFMIETTYRLPIYRQRTYNAATLEEACRLAVADDDWTGQNEDVETAGETYVTGAWPGTDSAYRVSPLSIPSEFSEKLQRQAEHFETLLGILKILTHAPDCKSATDSSYWRERAHTAIAKAEAILSGFRDPEETGR